MPDPEPSTRPPATVRTAPGLALLLLTLLLSLPTITTDLYLPALPTLTGALGATMVGGQLTLGVLSLSFAFAQLATGPFADRFGRRPVLTFGLCVYTAASVGSVLATTMTWLVVTRAIQGIGLATAVVSGRAILRDLYDPEHGARVLARALTGLGMIAVLGPVIGGATVALGNWRLTLALPAAFGAMLLWLVLSRYAETAPRQNPEATRVGPMLATWRTVLANATFLRFTALSTFTYAGVYAYLAGSAFVIVGQWGVSRPVFGLLMATISCAYIAGTIVCRRLVARHGVPRTIGVALWFSLVGGLLMLALSLAGAHTPWAIVVPQCIFHFGHGIHQPCAQSGAVGPFPHAAGAASALSGFIMILFSFPIGLYLGYALVGASWPLPLALCLCGLATAATAWLIAHRKSNR
jgi:DHA1 family bicyclomycin/chloramphenicol resistance-like MFS transporter